MGLLALVVMASPAAATELKDQGNTGFITYNDESGNTSVTCRYTAGGSFDRVSVVAPFAHSSDTGFAINEKQWVGWRVEVQRRTPGGGAWKTFATTGFQKRQATQVDIGAFAPRVVDLPSGNWQWRVKSVIRYYAKGSMSTVIGTRVYRYDWYKSSKKGDPSPYESPDYCLPHY
jgi:hypothetical protein